MRTVNVAVVALLVGCAHAQPPAEAAAQQTAKPAPPAHLPAPAAKPVEAARKAAPMASPASIYSRGPFLRLQSASNLATNFARSLRGASR